MICRSCGNELKEGAAFCGKCGTPTGYTHATDKTEVADAQNAVDRTVAASVQNTEKTIPVNDYAMNAENTAPYKNNDFGASADMDATVAAVYAKETAPVKEVKKAKGPKPKMSKGKKALISICCVLVVLIGASVAVVLSIFNSPAKQVADLLEEKKFSKAVSLYESKVDGNFIQEKLLVKFTEGYSDEIYNAYVAEGMPADEAIEALESVKTMNVFDVGDISAKLENVKNLQDSREAYESAIELYEQGDYIGAGEEFKKVIETDEDYNDAQKRVEECNEKYKGFIFEQVGTPATDGEYESAIAVLEDAALSTGDSEINEKLKTVKSKYAQMLKDRAFSESIVLLEQKKYVEAFEIINKAAVYNEGDTEIASLISSVTVEYETYVITTADAHLAKYEYDNALEVVDGGLSVLPQSRALNDKKTAIEAAIPVSLSKELMINSDGWAWNEGAPIDPFNNDYSGSSNYAMFDCGCRYQRYGEFRVYGKYSKLSGKITPHKDIGEGQELYIQIYADDTLIYTSPTIGRKTDTIVFDLDLKKADYVKIIVYPLDYYGSFGPRLILSDLMLHS